MGFDMNVSSYTLETLKLLLMASLVPMKVGNSIENSWIKLGKQRALCST